MTVEYIKTKKEAKKKKSLLDKEKKKDLKKNAFWDIMRLESGQIVFKSILENLGFTNYLSRDCDTRMYNFGVELFKYLKDIDEDDAFKILRSLGDGRCE